MLRPCLILLSFVFASAAFGQATSTDDPISTARPSFSDSSQIVAKDHLQLESGLSYYRRGGASDQRWDFGEALLRYGVESHVEVRLQLPNYNLGTGSAPDGFDNTSLAASFYLGKFLGIDVGIIPTVSFPTGVRDLRYDSVTPSFTLNLQRNLGSGASLSSTLGQTYERHDTQSIATLVYARPTGKKLVTFVEYAGFFDPRGEPTQYAHVGLQFLNTKNSQFDIHGGVGLNEATAHAFIGAGYSVRF